MPYPFSYVNEVVTKGICIFRMVNGNTKAAILAGVNMERDTDCVAAVAAGIAGALDGTASVFFSTARSNYPYPDMLPATLPNPGPVH